MALEKGRPGEAYNLSSGRGVSVRDLFDLVCREAEVELRSETSWARARGITYLVADTSKTRREVGWAPRYLWSRLP